MRSRQITLKNMIYLNLLFIIFSSYPACHNLIADLDEIEWNKWFTKRYLQSSDWFLVCHNAPRPSRGDAASDSSGLVLTARFVGPVLREGESWSDTSGGERLVCFQKRLDVMRPEPAHVYEMWYTWISVNELFKDLNHDVSFLPCSDEQNAPQRHIFPRPECIGPNFFLAIHFSSFFVICVSFFTFICL